MTYYDKISEGYEELHKEEQLKKIDAIKKYMKPKPEDKLLDVGCGTGLTTELWNCIKIGIDPSKKLIEKAREKARETKSNAKYIVAAAEEIPFEDKTFDYVISVTAVQNFNDIEKGLREMKRVGKERFIISFLKRSEKRDKIDGWIRSIFNVKTVIEQEKDIIYVI